MTKFHQMYEQYSTMALSAWGFTDLPSYTDRYDPNEKYSDKDK